MEAAVGKGEGDAIAFKAKQFTERATEIVRG